MHAFLALAAVVAGIVVASSMYAESPQDGESLLLRPAIEDFVVVDYVSADLEVGPKAPARPVHVLASNPVKVFARTSGVVRLDVAVQLNGTDSFGVFSGYPDGQGLVSLSLTLPAGGSEQYVRVPGPEGRRSQWEVPPGTVFYLVPKGILSEGSAGISYGPTNEPVIIGDPVWVRLDE